MVRRLEQSEATATRLVRQRGEPLPRRVEEAGRRGLRLLEAAWQRFSALPYEAVRLADVAADAGVTVQTLHARFGTKEQLFTSAYRRWMAEQGRRRMSARIGDVEDVVRLLYDNYDDQGEIGLRMIAQEDRIEAIRTDTDR